MDDFERRMALLKKRFAERATTDAAALTAAWASRDHATAIHIAHGLAGSAGIFGYAELSAAARDFELAVEQSAPDSQIQLKLDALLALVSITPGD